MSLRVAIVGRPNVGKSTLFNRLAGRKLALVHDTPGVTRDWREADARLGDLSFTAVDTAGFEDASEGLSPRMRAQTERALKDAAVALFLIDARAGVTPLDEHFASWLRRLGRPVVLVANKCEAAAAEAGRLEGFALGFGEPVAVSAEHGQGLADLYDALRDLLSEPHPAGIDATDEPAADKPLRLAVIGRPNVGKSTLVNRLLGEDRMMTGPEPGITRDSIATRFVWHGRQIQLADTAGLRRRARVVEKLESMSTTDTLRAVRFAEVVVIVLDSEAPLEKQDLTIARMVTEEGRAMVIALNKWDRVDDRQRTLREVRMHAEDALSQVRDVAVIPCSALTGQGVDKLMDAVFKSHEIWNRRVPTAELNRWLEAATESHPPPLVQGRRLRIRYMSQVKARPPTFVLFANKPGELPQSYLRYLTNGLRDAFGLAGVPLRIEMRKGDNPYAGKATAKRRKK